MTFFFEADILLINQPYRPHSLWSADAPHADVLQRFFGQQQHTLAPVIPPHTQLLLTDLHNNIGARHAFANACHCALKCRLTTLYVRHVVVAQFHVSKRCKRETTDLRFRL